MAADNLTQRTTIRQKGSPFVIAVGAAVCLAVCFGGWGPGGAQQSCEIRLESRINPNEAPVASLVRLPGVGIARAGAIVAYREQFGEKQPDREVFENCDDLQKVKGIGPKTAQWMCRWLKFE